MIFSPHSDYYSQKHDRGIASIRLPFKGEVAKIELILKGKPLPVDKIIVSDQPLPSLKIGLTGGSSPPSAADFLSIGWKFYPTPPSPIKEISFAVQVRYDKDAPWQTIAINLDKTSFQFPAYRIKGFDTIYIKVIASDRFQTSEGELTISGKKPKP
jgi:hypothetical protein